MSIPREGHRGACVRNQTYRGLDQGTCRNGRPDRESTESGSVKRDKRTTSDRRGKHAGLCTTAVTMVFTFTCYS